MEQNHITAYIVSDVHLNHHSYDRDVELENPHRREFRKFLSQLNDEFAKPGHHLLILNGDIFDITGSWVDMPPPWDTDQKQVEALLLKTLTKIIENNRQIITAFQALLQHPQVEFIYIFGNHDRLLSAFPSSQVLLKQSLSSAPSHQERIQFFDAYETYELGLYAEHGHRLDPFNYETYQQNPPLGDIINVLIVNRFVELTRQKLKNAGYSTDLIDEIVNILQDVENLKPISLGPYWLATVAQFYQHHGENRGKPLSINFIIHQVIEETLLDDPMVRLLAKRFLMPQFVIRFLLKSMVSFPGILQNLSLMASLIMHKTESNKYQAHIAQAIHQKAGFHLITFGHTHIPGIIPLSEDSYFFNTGCWKPIIHLFRPQGRPPGILESLGLRIPFNKIERSAIFQIEKSPEQPHHTIQFKMKTAENGWI